MKSFLAYVGGKSLLAEKIVSILPSHHCYAEVFGGAGWVMFAKPPSKSEVINDINRDLITTYRVIKYHTREFLAQLKAIPVARDEFERFLATDVRHLTDIQRAVRFYYLIRAGYGGKVIGQTLAAARTRSNRFNPISYKRDLIAVSKRLQKIMIENLDYKDFISRYDGSETLFYIDPPYYEYENHYGKGIFSRDDFDVLNDLLKGIQGKFVLSINDHPKVREIFAGFNLQEVSTTYSLAGANKRAKANELLLTNF